jgi:hypothetical protein
VVVQRNEGRQASGDLGYGSDKDEKRWENTKYRVWFVRGYQILCQYRAAYFFVSWT